ncbi:activating signal cointegrator 1 [Scaptodrosophila lebanonensis]|uniref:Activating signal cointegrator 1 n=1 Tax=Drosophila lebanonensis TaxID=7225 RepID=A0A6J2U3B7_DROLE|nr:activating signal cointegrator 1 [Scaptodrosophila lebanonensis]
MEKWVRDTLSKCLDCMVTDQMLAAILNIKDDYEFDNYFGNLLSEENEEHRLFLLNCRRMLLSGKQARNTTKSRNSPQTPTKSSPQTTQKQGGGAAKKQVKYTNLYASDGKVIGDTILLKGRRSCDCQASQHKLINNCMGCGRIVCFQEGSGPCLYCGELVYTPEEEQQMAKQQKSSAASSSKSNAKGKKQPQQQQAKANKDVAALQQALAQRDRLLEYDRNSEKRTTVIDDELDYFQENSVWLTDAEREKYERLKSEMHEMKHGSRIKRKIKVDFAGRELPEELPVTQEYEQQVLRELAAVSKTANVAQSTLTGRSSMILAPNLDMAKPPLFKPNKAAMNNLPAQQTHDGLERIYNRVQDKELLEMQDMRQCLSMHQPWASLLVAGIKKHEGRVWYSEHRGRLWIASTAKEPHAEDIAQMEEFYRQLYNNPKLKFPTHYPTSSLLGCVHVDSCLPQEEYRELFPNGESDSPYVFVCTNPEQLPLLLPVQGEHKIYELPLKTHNAACKTLLRARTTKG